MPPLTVLQAQHAPGSRRQMRGTRHTHARAATRLGHGTQLGTQPSMHPLWRRNAAQAALANRRRGHMLAVGVRAGSACVFERWLGANCLLADSRPLELSCRDATTLFSTGKSTNRRDADAGPVFINGACGSAA